jgi:hypothetical protein
VRGPYAQAALQALVLAADSGVPTNLADRRYASAPLRQATFVHGTVEQAGHESSVLSWSLPVSAERCLGYDYAWIRETAMTTYTVGMKLQTGTKALTIEAEDALLAALKIKLENPEAFITYVRKSNRRGDRRHPHEALQNKKVA